MLLCPWSNLRKEGGSHSLTPDSRQGVDFVVIPVRGNAARVPLPQDSQELEVPISSSHSVLLNIRLKTSASFFRITSFPATKLWAEWAVTGTLFLKARHLGLQRVWHQSGIELWHEPTAALGF
jgi:hypothetical protein